MSEFQISLLGVGAVVIVAVYLFNLQQERRFRHKADRAFAREHDDVLLENSAEERLEPQLNLGPAAQSTSAIESSHIQSAIDPFIDYVVEVTLKTPNSGGELQEELRTLVARVRKPVMLAGRDATGRWIEIGNEKKFLRLRFALQTLNRGGAVDQAALAAFRDTVLTWAARAGAEASYGDVAAVHQSTVELDRFCAEVDVAIGLNVISVNGQPFQGTEIRRLAEAAGVKLEADGVFYYYENGHGPAWFTIDNHEPMPFVPEQINTLQTTGITLLLDVPHIAQGGKAFDCMVETARNLAAALGGVLADDKRRPLSETAIGRIRADLDAVSARMNAAQIPAGSARALRIFS